MEMTMDEVINGRGDGSAFPGLMGVVNAYLNSLNVDVATKCDLRRYLDLIKWRARGESSSNAVARFKLTDIGKLVTPASWIRNFILSHPAYNNDSVVSDEINYDLAKAIDEM
jgi:glutamate--cysteine ligase catalytic subunit